MSPGTSVIRLALSAVLAWGLGLGPAPGGGPGPARGPSERGGPAYGTYAWPVQGPVIRGFEPPPDPYGAGHRGIDIGAPFGSPVVAAQDGTVAFAGWVAGSMYVSIDHADGVRTTYSWLSAVAVADGQSVTKGEVIGSTGQGDPGSLQPNLHFGARLGAAYIDPMPLLIPGDLSSLIHLAPLGAEPPFDVPMGPPATGQPRGSLLADFHPRGPPLPAHRMAGRPCRPEAQLHP